MILPSEEQKTPKIRVHTLLHHNFNTLLMVTVTIYSTRSLLLTGQWAVESDLEVCHGLLTARYIFIATQQKSGVLHYDH